MKVDCPTYPFCNHIPAPPPLLPPPLDLQQPQPGILYPWGPAMTKMQKKQMARDAR